MINVYDFNRVHEQLCASNLRLLTVVSGDKAWCANQIESFLEEKTYTTISHCGDEKNILPSKATTLLGSEVEFIVFDAHETFDVNAFAAVSGTIKGGGMLFLLTPPLGSWSQVWPRRFLSRLIHLFRNDKNSLLIEQGKSISKPALPAVKKHQIAGLYKTNDQKIAVESILVSSLEKRPPAIVITADRGRGKSASLGLAAATIMAQTGKKLVITAPRFSVCRVFYRHLQQQLPDAKRQRAEVRHGNSVCRFIAPDELFLNPVEADIIFVDEAASIPTFILQRLLAHCPGVVLSTTTHGYEGSGQGFMNRFLNSLKECQIPHRHITMQSPIRWADADPLEQFVSQALLLNTELPSLSAGFSIDDCKIITLDRNKLVQNEQQLGDIVGLLKQAHYRTRPSDLLQMLDAEDHHILCCEHKGQTIALVWVCHENRLNDQLGNLVYQGKRRPDGHLLAQSLTYHAGFKTAYAYRYTRIIRIAVHPELRRKGVASRLLEAVYSTSATDIIGASFAGTADLYSFWASNGFVAGRLGLKRNASSGAHSLIMLRARSTLSNTMVDSISVRFSQQIQDTLSLFNDTIDHSLQEYLLAPLANTTEPAGLTKQDISDIDSYAKGYRGLELNIHAIRKLIRLSLENGRLSSLLDQRQQGLLRDLATHIPGNTEVCRAYDISSKKDYDNSVVEAITLLQH